MKKVSVMLEVDDTIYNCIVYPRRKEKTFSKLVASLLQGYANDNYVKAYAENTLNDLKKASVLALEGTIDEMQQSLSSLGLFTDELKSGIEYGQEYFGGGQESVTQPQPVNKDYDERMSRIEDQQNKMYDMLCKLMENGISVSSSVEESKPVQEEVVEEVDEKKIEESNKVMDALMFGNSMVF